MIYKSLFVALILLGMAYGQVYNVSPSTQTAAIFNIVQIDDITHPDTPNWKLLYGPVGLVSITTSGTVATATTNNTRALTKAVVGDTVNVHTDGMNTQALPSDLTGNFVLTGITKISGGAIQYTWSSTATDSYALTAPNNDQGPLAVCYNNTWFQMFDRSTSAYNNQPYGSFYTRTSSSSCGTNPIVWNNNVTFLFTPPSTCGNPGGTCALFGNGITLLPGTKRIILLFNSIDYSNLSGQVWYTYFDGSSSCTDPTNIACWSNVTQITALPVGKTTWLWECINTQKIISQTNGTLGIFLMGFGVVGSPCSGHDLYYVQSRDNGATWGATPSTDIHFIMSTAPTAEIAGVNPSGNNIFAFLRPSQSTPLTLLTSTDMGSTWTSANSTLPNPSGVCTPINNYNDVSPEISCGHPTSSLCSVFYYFRCGSNTAYGALSAFVVDPTQVFSSGASYINTLGPGISTFWKQWFGPDLFGYQNCYFTSLTDFNCWFVGPAVNTALKSFQVNGKFVNTVSTLTITCSGVASGTVSSLDGNISCSCSAGTASGTCSENVPNGTNVVLSAVSGQHSSFGSFSGACSGGSPLTCNVPSNSTVTATFNVLIPDEIISGKQNQGGTISSQ